MRKFTRAISLILALAIMLCALMSLTACNEDKDGKADDPAGENNNPGGDNGTSNGGDTTPGGDTTTPGGNNGTSNGGDTTPGGDTTTPGGDNGTSNGGDTTPGGDNGTSNGGDTTVERSGYVRVDAEGNESATGSYIKFGTYPQSEVTDATLKNTLTTMAGTLPVDGNNSAWTSYKYYQKVDGAPSNETDYMWYQDISHNGEKYRGVYFTSYRPYYTENTSNASNSRQDDNGYIVSIVSKVYWFKYEPILWRILTEENGKALLLCEMVIDSQEYYHEDDGTRTGTDNLTIHPNNYAHSNIRKWLNDNFYNTAFTELEKQLIALTTVDNSVESTGWSSNNYICEDTNDYIFLPSAKEVTTEAYGFTTSNGYTTTREKQTTAYAQCQGAITSTSDAYAGNGYWWLRSPSRSLSDVAHAVMRDGNVYFDYISVGNTDYGVAPALWIEL